MNWAHLHLLINHAPLWAVVVGVCLLVAAIARNHGAWKDAAFWILALSGLVTFIVYTTGDPASEDLNAPLTAASFIEAHRDASAWAFGALMTMSAAGLAGALILPRQEPGGVSQRHSLFILGVALLSAAILGWVGHLGGKIVHEGHMMGTVTQSETP